MPNDHAVNVTFNPPNSSSWSFTPQQVTMNGAGKITMSRVTNVTPVWVFSDDQPNLPQGCTFKVKDGGEKLEITDDDQDDKGTWQSYSIIVRWNGTNYPSPMSSSPHVTADGGTGIPPMLMNE